MDSDCTTAALFSSIAETGFSFYYRHSVATAKNLPDPESSRERLVSATAAEDDSSFELKLRPQKLSEFIGQKKVKDNLAIAAE